jgi:uncharacterized membrane protein YgcG
MNDSSLDRSRSSHREMDPAHGLARRISRVSCGVRHHRFRDRFIRTQEVSVMQTNLFRVLPVAALAAVLVAGCATQQGPEPMNPYESGDSAGATSGGGMSSGGVGSSSSSSGMGGGAM